MPNASSLTKQADFAVEQVALQAINELVTQGYVLNYFNKPLSKQTVDGSLYSVTVRYLDKVGALNPVFKVFDKYGVNVQEFKK